MLGDLQLWSERFRLPSPVGEHRCGGHQQHRAFQFLLRFEVLQKRQQLNGFAQAHVVSQTGPLIEAVQEGEPAEAPLLIGPQLTAETFRGRQGVGGLLLVVLLQHRLQPWAGVEAVHRHPHQQFPFRPRQPQRVVEAQFRFRPTEAFGIFEVVGPQFDPGPLVAHQGAALAAQALQFPQGERHPADHQIPLPVQTLTQRETARALGQFRFDRQAQSAGQATGEAGRQLHSHAGIPQLPGGRAHQHEGLGRGELHRFRCGALQTPLNGRKHAQGAAHAFQQHFTRLVHPDLSKL